MQRYITKEISEANCLQSYDWNNILIKEQPYALTKDCYYVDVIKAMKAPQRRVKWIQMSLLLLKLCNIKLI